MNSCMVAEGCQTKKKKLFCFFLVSVFILSLLSFCFSKEKKINFIFYFEKNKIKLKITYGRRLPKLQFVN